MSEIDRQECDRCGNLYTRLVPLDAVVHPYDNQVCENCLKDTDEVVDP